jgi:hypothetical protein
MKLFLTRIGFGAKAVVTGDVTQIDLPPGTTAGPFSRSVMAGSATNTRTRSTAS